MGETNPARMTDSEWVIDHYDQEHIRKLQEQLAEQHEQLLRGQILMNYLLGDHYHAKPGNFEGYLDAEFSDESPIVPWEHPEDPEPLLHHPIVLGTVIRKSGLKIQYCCTRDFYEAEMIKLNQK